MPTDKKVKFACQHRDELFVGLSAITKPAKVEELRDKLIPILDKACEGFFPSEAAFALQMCVDGYLSMTFDFNDDTVPTIKRCKRARKNL